MRDDLLGYLVGALDAEDEARIRQRLQTDHELQEQLDRVRGRTQLLRRAADVEPPRGLAERTLRQIDASSRRPLVDVVAAATDTSDVQSAEMSPAARHDLRDDARRWTLADFVVAAGVCIAAACLFFPAVVNSRYHSHLTACQNNMRLIGNALVNYASNNHGYFPSPSPRGPMAAAGVYAPKLISYGLVSDERVFLCPAKGSAVVVQIPKPEDILSAAPSELVTIHKSMGGDFAYSLGYINKGRLHSVRNQHRELYALLADAPIEISRDTKISSHGHSHNVLFEDGHVATLAKPVVRSKFRDELFLNDQGQVQAGLHENDAVLAPSSVPPLPVRFNKQ